jgi:TetR/AcrR family transcriptional repressor of bet genes
MPKKNTRERRQQIARALLTVMAEHGFVRASVKKIAEEAGITPGLVHYHFENKQQILLQLVEDLGAGPIHVLDGIVDSEAPPIERLRQIVELFLGTGDTADGELVSAWVVVSGESVRQPEVAEAFGVIIRRCRNAIAEVIRQARAAGELPESSSTPEALATGLLATVQGYFTFAAADPELVPEHSAARVVQDFFRLEEET